MRTEHKTIRIAAAAAALVLLALVLASCGGSSGSSTTGTTAGQAAATIAPSATATTAPNGTTTAGGSLTPSQGTVLARVKALRECLARNGVNLPKPGSGQTGLPQGVSRAQYEAALHKCAPNLKRPANPGAIAGSKGARPGKFQKALESFAACMRSHGIKLPAPSGAPTGPIFDTKGIDTTAPAFRAATAACRATLRAALPGR